MVRSVVLVVGLSLVVGCASMFMKGGEIVKANHGATTLVNYRAEGTLPPNTTYQLVRTADGKEAMFERDADGTGVFFTNSWRENDEDHYFGWVGTGPGYEFVVPVDRTKPARKYFYPKGTYGGRSEGGVTKPTLSMKFDPVATLYPQ